MDTVDLYIMGIGVLVAFTASTMLLDAVPGLILSAVGGALLCIQLAVFLVGDVDISDLSLEVVLKLNWLPARTGIPLGLVLAASVHVVKLLVSFFKSRGESDGVSHF